MVWWAWLGSDVRLFFKMKPFYLSIEKRLNSKFTVCCLISTIELHWFNHLHKNTFFTATNQRGEKQIMIMMIKVWRDLNKKNVENVATFFDYIFNRRSNKWNLFLHKMSLVAFITFHLYHQLLQPFHPEMAI